ncbi:MAG: hypothetical protein SNG27_08715 [Rikenellaceae bacterium]
MEREYIDEICNYIKEIFSYSRPIIWSWGAEKYRNIAYNDMPALRFNVNGYLHKGDVIVALNEGADAFEVFCLDDSDKVIKSKDDVYFDELVGVIDKFVENDGQYDR